MNKSFLFKERERERERTNKAKDRILEKNLKGSKQPIIERKRKTYKDQNKHTLRNELKKE